MEYDGKVPSIVYDDYVAQNLSVAELSKQRDLLWGTNTMGTPHRDVQKNDYDPEGTVDFHFRHAPAKVNFAVRGTLSGEVLSFVSSGATSTSYGTAADPLPDVADATTEFDEPNVSSSITSPNNWSGSGRNQYRDYTCTQTWTLKESFTQEQIRIKTESRTSTYSTEGKRYLVESVSFKGFNKTGTLVLDNTASYTPLWTNVTPFNSPTPEYVLNSSNVLAQSLQYVNASTVQNNYNTYTGVTETATNLMGDYYLYSIPKTVSSHSDRIQVSLTYHILNVTGTLNGSEARETEQYRTRKVERTLTKTRTATRRRYRYSDNNAGGSTATPSSASDFTFTQEWDEISGSLGNWTYNSYGNYTDKTPGNWERGNMTLSNATVNYNDDTHPTLNGEILTSFQGGRAYTINLILAGDKIQLDVVPRPWELQETVFDYTSDINDVIQALTYDSAYIDYADAQGNVYINNRMGKFSFRLGSGKYKAWQASLVGDSAFGFTDENGNFLLDGSGNRVSSIRAGIDPAVMNYIYVKAINSSATVTSRAKLRIYYIDANNDVTAALNLVNQQGVNEWTIIQNAN